MPPKTTPQARIQERGAIDLARLDRPDLEALCSLKLWEELGLRLEEARGLLESSSVHWMRQFLDHAPRAIGEAPIDLEALTRARARMEPTTRCRRGPLVRVRAWRRGDGRTRAEATKVERCS